MTHTFGEKCNIGIANGRLYMWLCMTLSLIVSVLSLDNGLARTPPMGWLSWERFRCNIDCHSDPNNCISEKLFMMMADLMVKHGYKEAGYEYVSIDDCWLSKERDSKGRLQPDPDRFPSGIKALADYMHARGLKLGIYEDFGTKTCAGYPGSEYHLEQDAQTFADWGVDLLKLDGCYSDPHQYNDAYPAMSQWLNRTGRPILFSCSWPAYQEAGGIKPDYDRIAKYCNIWRNWGDISDSWASVQGIIRFYGDDHTQFARVAGSGNFNDPDMLIVGNYGLSYEQQRVQMALWAIMASPLIMSVDLRTIATESSHLLLNKRVIAVNQDALAVQGRRILKVADVQYWRRPILPKGSYAFAFLFTGTGGRPEKVTMKLSAMGLNSTHGYKLTEVFDGVSLGTMMPNSTFTCHVNPTGVYFVTAVRIQT